MGRKAKSIELNTDQRAELEKGYRTGTTAFSRRCHMILLISENRTSKEVADITGTNQISVNGRVKRFETEGISGLKTKPGRGRKRILEEQQDGKKVKAAVKKERQRLKHAKYELENERAKN